MKTRTGAAGRTFQVVRKRKPAPTGRHLTWRRDQNKEPWAATDLSGLVLYGQA
jgi:hypothetical protein